MPRVLVVDGSVSVRRMIEHALEMKGYEALSASSGAEALERIGTTTPDLVVCDVAMPDVDGYRICEFVRGHGLLSETPVLLTSGVVDSAVLERAAQAGSSDVLPKPFTADDLLRKVDELVAARPQRTEPPTVLPAAVADEMPARPDLKATMGQLAATPGVRMAALVDREGFLIEAAGEIGIGAEYAGALAACLTESSEGIGREMEQGALSSMLLDYEGGLVLVRGAGPSAILAVVLRDPTALGKFRHYAETSLPDLLRSM